MSQHEETILRIRAAHRERCYAMEQRKRADLALGAYIRTQLGWSLNLTPPERKKIEARAKEIVADPSGTSFEAVVVGSKQAAKPMADIEKAALKQMETEARTLPVWDAFGLNIRGFGAGSLAVIVGETGDLSNYSTHSKVWKRLGLAVMDGVRQGGLGKNAGKEAWIEHGYSPMRRSRVWNIGDALIKGNRDGYYRAVYLGRKEYELAREPGMKPIQAHRRAQRYMEKRLTKHLWQAWRARDVMAERPYGELLAEIADAPKGAVSAIVGAPKGQISSADTTNTNAPQGAGEAKHRVPELAENSLPPRKKAA